MDNGSLLADASSALASLGVTGLCHPSSNEFAPFFPRCLNNTSTDFRDLLEDTSSLTPTERDWFYLKNGLLAGLCVLVAALAAGLTMGLMSIDPLMLAIKMRAGATETERKQAASLLPVVKQHHLLLVTLLLLNSMANEALPLFLDKIVPSYLAIIFSVTLVLFFGEIIPSAVFTGPNQMAIASKLIPLVRIVMCLLLPLSFPIAKLLDWLLHDDEEGSNVYNRKELSALVRIQYEEHLAAKRRRRTERTKVQHMTSANHSASSPTRNAMVDVSVREAKREMQHQAESKATSTASSLQQTASLSDRTTGHPQQLLQQPQRSPSIHFDEVTMIEGALSMKTKMAMDVYTPIRKIFAIPYDTLLDEETVVNIYSSGYSRIPVFVPNYDKPKDITAICGVLMTKQLIVIDASDARPVATFPLYTPRCVSPKKNLVDLINMFQTGGSHLALVCARPDVGNESLERGEALPKSAGLMGIITLEDVLEQLLQEQILDETDKLERDELRLAKWVSARWKLFVSQRKFEREEEELFVQDEEPRLLDVVHRATAARRHSGAEETTGLLRDEEEPKRRSSFLSFLGSSK